MTEKSDDLLEARARSLAIVHLTRRPDLTLSARREDAGVDLVVRLQTGRGRPSLRTFAVIVKAAVAAWAPAQAGKALRRAVQSLPPLGEVPYPVCLFFFTMQDDKGYYCWVREPVVTDGGQPRFVSRRDPEVVPLTKESLDGIVTQVDRWYDAFYAVVTA